MVLKLKVNSTSIITFATKSDLFGMSTNAENISTVSSAVKTNADNITTLSNAVSTNCTDITTLSNAVSSNASSITTLSNAVSSHATELLSIHNNINSNAADILTVSNAVSSNASNITALSNAVSTKIDQANIATWGNLLAGRDEYYNEEGTEKDLSGHVISGEIGKGLLRGINSNASSIRSLQGDIDNIENLSYKDFKTYLSEFIDERVFGSCRLSVTRTADADTQSAGAYIRGLAYNGVYAVHYASGGGEAGVKILDTIASRSDGFYVVGGFSSLTRHDWHETAVNIPYSPFLISPYINNGMYTGRSWRVLKNSIIYNKPFFSKDKYLLNIPEKDDDDTIIINRSIEISTKGVRALNGSITLGGKLLTDSYQAFYDGTYMLKYNDLSIGTIHYQKLTNLPPYKMDIAIDYDTGNSCLLVDEPEEVYIDIAYTGADYTVYGFSLNKQCQISLGKESSWDWYNIPMLDTKPDAYGDSTLPAICKDVYGHNNLRCMGERLDYVHRKADFASMCSPQYAWSVNNIHTWHNFYSYRQGIGWEWQGAVASNMHNKFLWSNGDALKKYTILGTITITKTQGTLNVKADKNDVFVLPEITRVESDSHPDGFYVTTVDSACIVGKMGTSSIPIKVADSSRREYIYLYSTPYYNESLSFTVYFHPNYGLCLMYNAQDYIWAEK